MRNFLSNWLFLLLLLFISAGDSAFCADKARELAEELGKYIEEAVPRSWGKVTHFLDGVQSGQWKLRTRAGLVVQESSGAGAMVGNFTQPIRYDLGISRLFNLDERYDFTLSGNDTLLIRSQQSRGALAPEPSFSVTLADDPVRPVSVSVKSGNREVAAYRMSYDGDGRLQRIDFTCEMDSRRISMWNVFSDPMEGRSPDSAESANFRNGSATLRSTASVGSGDEAESLFRRSVVYLKNDTLDLALESFQKAIEIEPSIISMDDTGLSNLLMKRYERVVSISPTNPDAYFFIGAIDFFKGKPAVARQNLETAVRLDPQGRIGRLAALLLKQAPQDSGSVNYSVLGSVGFQQKPLAPPSETEQKPSVQAVSGRELPVGTGAMKNTGVLKFSVSGKLEGRYYARVVLESLDESFNRSVEAAEGVFKFRNIPPGVYRVYPEIGKKTVESNGSVTVSDDFTSYEAVEIEISDNDMSDLVLRVLQD